MRIELKNIYKSFDKKTNTIENLNLTVEDGEFTALLGPSGCGKTTTMLMIAGIYKPDAGEIRFNGQNVNALEPKDRNIGMVFQSYALYPHMTVLENIAFPLKQKKLPKKERIERAKKAAEMVKLDGLLDRRPGELSGGQQQRVALARAIVKQPKVLLLDEPLSNLDARLKIEMRAEIARIQKELGITTILVTHDQEEAMTLADRIAVMKDGRIIQYDTPAELYKNPKNYFVAQFIGTPPMNFIKGRIADQQLQIAGKSYFLNRSEFDLTEDREVIAGVRPHEIQFDRGGDIRMKGTVELVETVGYAKIVNVKVEEEHFRFFANTATSFLYGSEIEFSFPSASLHLFDARTGASLKREAGKEKELEAIGL